MVHVVIRYNPSAWLIAFNWMPLLALPWCLQSLVNIHYFKKCFEKFTLALISLPSLYSLVWYCVLSFGYKLNFIKHKSCKIIIIWQSIVNLFPSYRKTTRRLISSWFFFFSGRSNLHLIASVSIVFSFS